MLLHKTCGMPVEPGETEAFIGLISEEDKAVELIGLWCTHCHIEITDDNQLEVIDVFKGLYGPSHSLPNL